MRRIIPALLLSLLLSIPQIAAATTMIEYKGASAYGPSLANQLLAEVKVGPSDVDIGGFGVYGQALANENLKWIIFDEASLTSPVYLSAAVAVSGGAGTFADLAQWYDMAVSGITLLSGHTYAMGVIADNSFRWGSSYLPLGGSPTSANGLTLTIAQALVKAGVVGNAFTNLPQLWSPAVYSHSYETSLRIFAPEIVEADPPTATPEPATMVLLGSSLLGLRLMRRRAAA